jgi:DUF4097 and DUF4098 domain-containing protein YvlB
MKSVLVGVAVTLSAALGTACVVVDSQGHVTREEKRFSVRGVPDLKLTTFDGPIEIRAGDDRAVIIEIERRGPTEEAVERLQVETRQDGNRIEVEAKKPTGTSVFFGIGRNMSTTVRLIVTAPRASNVVASSGDGSIRLEQLHGNLEVTTGDGSIRGSEIAGQLKLHTGDGSVTLDRAEGSLDLFTSDGSVSVAGKLGIVKVHTGDGSVTLRADAGTVMEDEWSIETGDGNVSVYLPSDMAARLDASTGDGAIRSELNITSSGAETTKRRLQGQLGSGGRLLRIRTGDGGIRLKSS